MAKDTFRWVAQPPGDELKRKINSEISQAEESGYELEDKEILEKPAEGEDNRAIVLLHFTKSKYQENDEGAFIEAVDISIGDSDEEHGYADKEIALREELAGTINSVEDHHPDHEIVGMELDEEGRTLYLRFEPF